MEGGRKIRLWGVAKSESSIELLNSFLEVRRIDSFLSSIVLKVSVKQKVPWYFSSTTVILLIFVQG